MKMRKITPAIFPRFYQGLETRLRPNAFQIILQLICSGSSPWVEAGTAVYSKRIFVPVAVFDLDHTLAHRATFFHFVMFCLTRTRWGFAMMPAAGLIRLFQALSLISREAAKEALLRLSIVGRSRTEVESLAQAFASRVVGAGCHSRVLKALTHHRMHGACVILATEAIDFYAEILGRRLGFDHVIATRSSWTPNDRLRPQILGKDCHGKAKLRRIQDLIRSLPGELVALYTDDESDLPLALVSGHELTAGGRPRKLHVAAEQGFRILEWREGER